MEAHKKNDGLKTLDQWQKDGLTKKEAAAGVELWNNSFYKYTALFYSADEVRPMTPAEITEYKTEKAAAKRKRNNEKMQKNIERDFAFFIIDINRFTMYTKTQFLLNYGRKLKPDAKGHDGNDLNYKDCASPFGRDYTYFHVKDTERITDPVEYAEIRKQSYENYYHEKVSDEDFESWKKTDLNQSAEDKDICRIAEGVQPYIDTLRLASRNLIAEIKAGTYYTECDQWKPYNKAKQDLFDFLYQGKGYIE